MNLIQNQYKNKYQKIFYIIKIKKYFWNNNNKKIDWFKNYNYKI